MCAAPPRKVAKPVISPPPRQGAPAPGQGAVVGGPSDIPMLIAAPRRRRGQRAAPLASRRCRRSRRSARAWRSSRRSARRERRPRRAACRGRVRCLPGLRRAARASAARRRSRRVAASERPARDRDRAAQPDEVDLRAPARGGRAGAPGARWATLELAVRGGGRDSRGRFRRPPHRHASVIPSAAEVIGGSVSSRTSRAGISARASATSRPTAPAGP